MLALVLKPVLALGCLPVALLYAKPVKRTSLSLVLSYRPLVFGEKKAQNDKSGRRSVLLPVRVELLHFFMFFFLFLKALFILCGFFFFFHQQNIVQRGGILILAKCHGNLEGDCWWLQVMSIGNPNFICKINLFHLEFCPSLYFNMKLCLKSHCTL